MVKVRMRWFANIIARFLPQLFSFRKIRGAQQNMMQAGYLRV